MKIARKKGDSILSRVPTMKTEFQSFLEACLQRQQRAMTCFAFKHGQDSVALFIESVSLQSLANSGDVSLKDQNEENLNNPAIFFNL